MRGDHQAVWRAVPRGQRRKDLVEYPYAGPPNELVTQGFVRLVGLTCTSPTQTVPDHVDDPTDNTSPLGQLLRNRLPCNATSTGGTPWDNGK